MEGTFRAGYVLDDWLLWTTPSLQQNTKSGRANKCLRPVYWLILGRSYLGDWLIAVFLAGDWLIFGKISFRFPTTGTKDAASPLNQELVSLSRGVWTDPSTEQSAEALDRTKTETVCHTPGSVHGRGGPHRTWTPSRPEEDRLGLGRVPARNGLPWAGSDPDVKRSALGLDPSRPEFDPFVSGSVHAQCRPARTGTGPTPQKFT